MRTVRTKVYFFNELSKDAQQSVISKMYDINVNYDWWVFMYDDAASVGLKITGFDLNRANYCNIEFIESDVDTANKIIAEHGEQCDTYLLSKSFLNERDEIGDIAAKDENIEFEDVYGLYGKLNEVDETFKNKLSKEYLSMLKDQYNYLTSYEAIKETIIANEHEFTADGKQFY